MFELQGTEKEIAYANSIREYVLYQLENLNAPKLEEKKQKFISAISKQKKAKVIIKSFVDSFKLKNVKAVALDFLTYENKFTQKEILSFYNRAITINENLKDDDYEIKRYEIEESKQEIEKEFLPATKKQTNYLKTLLENTDERRLELDTGIKLEYYKNLCKENTLSSKEASRIIDTLAHYQKIKYKSRGMDFFECQYDTYDCETMERITKGELVWKDAEGIHRADNY